MTTNQELRKLAEAATPGPWRLWKEFSDDGRPVVLEVCETQERGRHQHFASIVKHWPEAFSNATFIAAANPAKVIELLDRIDRLEAENEAQRKLLEQAQETISNELKPLCMCFHCDDSCKNDALSMAAILEAITQHLKGTP